ncbi:GNAT family N-acetyltransferase, partial [Acinetobacter baumannii]
FKIAMAQIIMVKSEPGYKLTL